MVTSLLMPQQSPCCLRAPEAAEALIGEPETLCIEEEPITTLDGDPPETLCIEEEPTTLDGDPDVLCIEED